MLVHNEKWLFSLMLMPSYFVMAIVLLCSGMGSIEWGHVAQVIIFNSIVAWLMSYKGNIYLPIIGLIGSCYFGWVVASRYFYASSMESLSIYDLYLGVGIFLLGILGFSRRLKIKKET